jgi:hypothetical protein
MVAKTVEAFGKLDFAFNKTGVLLESAPITEMASEITVRCNAIVRQVKERS